MVGAKNYLNKRGYKTAFVECLSFGGGDDDADGADCGHLMN